MITNPSPDPNNNKSVIRQRLLTFSMIILMSTGFSIEVEASETYTKVKILKQQSPLAEVVDFLGDWLN